ncbi:NAD(P)H-dependent oxidoreductase [uncultured Metabacillus sp.]|uniref:NAD(P)H-dependent oxidoreductase n=1 Tax=uncultured Metabacillus sp. TaxID=2860135 RepID=UPI0026335D90|nr:NAD(P)H-dependent oxidoreductase [uncultured Metabacillus sp.]
MKTLIILAHPNEDSFNHAICSEVKEHLTKRNFEVKIRDLYKLKFDPLLTEDNHTEFYQTKLPKDILEEQNEITWAENLVFIFPTWWCGMPAILKGYIDRVFTNGFAFRFGKGEIDGLLKGKRAIILQTTSQTEEFMKPSQLVSSMETSMDVGIFDYCGINVITHKFLFSVPHVDKETREKMLKEIKGITEIL